MYVAELRFNGHTPANTDVAIEVLRRCGLPLTTPEPEDPASGIWLIDLSPVQRHNLETNGELRRTFGPGTFVVVSLP